MFFSSSSVFSIFCKSSGKSPKYSGGKQHWKFLIITGCSRLDASCCLRSLVFRKDLSLLIRFVVCCLVRVDVAKRHRTREGSAAIVCCVLDVCVGPAPLTRRMNP